MILRVAFRWSAIRSYSALAIGVISIAWSAIFVRVIPMPGTASAFYRVFFASLVLFPFWVGRSKHGVVLSSRCILLGSVAGLFFAGDLSLFSTAVQHTSVANASVLANSSPIVLALLSWVHTRRAPKALLWFGLMVAMAGSVLVVAADLRRESTFGRGDLLALAAALSYAAYLVVTEKLRRRIDTSTVLAFSLIASTVFLLIFNVLVGVRLRAPRDSWFAIAGLALISQLVGYFALTYALGHFSAVMTSVSLLMQAALTTVLGLALLHESIGYFQIFGGLLVFLGVWIVNGAEKNSGTITDVGDR